MTNSTILPATIAPATISTDAAATLVKKTFSNKWEALLDALQNGDFYLELMMICVAVLLAGLVAYVVRRRIMAYFEKHPLQRIDIEFITKPLSLLAPLLSLFFLSVVKPFALEYSKSSAVTDSLIKLNISYIFAKIILNLVNSRPVAWFIALVIMIIAVLNVTDFMKSTSTYLEAMSFDAGKYKISMLNLTNGLVILVIVFWIAGLLSRTLESYLRRSSSMSYNARELSVKFFRIFIYFVAILITLSAVGVDLTAFAVFGGALGVGIGLGLQKITANFVSGITLLLEKSIKLGDLIEVAGNTGWVRALNIRYALMETSDGRELLIPNEELTSTRVTNWTLSNEQARIEVRAVLDFGTDAQEAIKIMLDCAKSHPRCIKDPKPLCWLRDFHETGLVFVLTFWIADVHEGRNTPRSEVMLAILQRFREKGIVFSQTNATDGGQ